MRFAVALHAALIVASATINAAGLPANSPPASAASSPGHEPCIFLTSERLQRIRDLEKSDSLMAALRHHQRTLAEEWLDATPIIHKYHGAGMLGQSRAMLGRMLSWGLEYQLTRDQRYAQRARQELLNVADFPDWFPQHFLGTAEIALALAVGHEWFYDALSADERATLRRALLEKALAFAPSAYGVPLPRTAKTALPSTLPASSWLAFGKGGTAINNWNQVCNGGLLAAALVLRDDEPDLSRLVIDGVRRSLPFAMAHYAPDGVWPEGPAYWSYGTTYNVIILDLLRQNLGTDYDLSGQPGFSSTADYYTRIFGPTGIIFNFGDSAPVTEHIAGCEPAYTWLASHFGPDTARFASRARLKSFLKDPWSSEYFKYTKGSIFRFLALHAIWFPDDTTPDAPLSRLPLDTHYRGTAEIVLLRSQWDSPNARWLALKSGANGFPHGNLDLGSFLLESDGVRWAHDLGPDSYRLPGNWDYKNGGKRWTYFRNNNHSHNTLTPGEQLQHATATAPVTRFYSAPDQAHAIVDMTDVYPGAARHVLRGVALIENRTRFLVQDEWTGIAASTPPLNWRMMTTSDIALSDDARSARLTRNGKTLHAEILSPASPGTRFAIESASPPSPDENPNTGFRILKLTTPSATDIRIAVLLTPGDTSLTQTPPALMPLKDWPDTTPRPQ
ncbi:Heparinase II/III-like protein [Opitutaceae bacterium TAV1]|nr:Heparinase II/III-like protein [Opitutaceae bacterium TAV1]